MSSIILSNPRSEPFGLLSNRANVKFISEGAEWKSASQYIFVNMFTNETYKFKMSEHVDRNPFNAMQTLKNEEDNLIYQREILKGLGIRFSQHPALRIRLLETKGKELIYSDPQIVSLLNVIRNNTNMIFDSVRKVEVSRKEINAVIAGVEREILKNPYLDDNLLYSDLIQYAIQNRQELPYGDEIFININNIVPILKNRLRQKIWGDQITKFKDHLLDVYLDYLLETEYPNVQKDDYRKAKNQQINKEKERNIEKYKNQLYDLYLNKEIDNLIIKRLQFVPDQTLQAEPNRHEELPEPRASLVQGSEPLVDRINIMENDPFLPNYIENVNIDSKNYKSVIHYAYFKLFQNIGFNIDINSIALNNLQQTYENAKNQWTYDKLKLNNETATIAKFKQNEILLHLLEATGDASLIWDDKSDPILGVGYQSHRPGNNEGDNLSGRFLEFLRNQPTAFGLHINPERKYIRNNVWEYWRTIALARDYLNTLKLLEYDPLQVRVNNSSVAATRYLGIIYKINPASTTDIVQKENIVNILKTAGLNLNEIDVIYPMILIFYESLTNRNEMQVINEWVEKNKKILKKPKIEFAKENLKNIFNTVHSSVTESVFIASILANKKTDDLNDAKWDRIKYWSN